MSKSDDAIMDQAVESSDWRGQFLRPYVDGYRACEADLAPAVRLAEADIRDCLEQSQETHAAYLKAREECLAIRTPSALAAFDAAGQGRTARIAVAADGEKWCAYGWNGAADMDMMDNAEEFLGTVGAMPLCYIEATLPPAPPVPFVTGEVCDGK